MSCRSMSVSSNPCFLIWKSEANVFFAQTVNGASTDAFATGESSSSAIKISSSASSIDDLSIDDLSGDQIKVNSAVAVEKEIAADTLGTVFVATKNLFLPFLESSTEALIDMLNHYYEGIRKSSISSLLDFIQTFYELSNPAPWEPGLHVVRVI
jgi:hypothetical protein